MYKSKLQELCHKKSLELPIYHTSRNGPAHMSRFTTTVNVQGQVFETPEECKSTKEAENTAARIAFEHLSAPPPVVYGCRCSAAGAPVPVMAAAAPPPAGEPLPVPAAAAPPPAGASISAAAAPPPEMQSDYNKFPPSPYFPNPPREFLLKRNEVNTEPANGVVVQENRADTQTSAANMISVGAHGKGFEAGLNTYKNQLQQYAQKRNLCLPVYTTESQGNPHEFRFKSRVCIDGKVYEAPVLFPTLKEAEQAAAKVACQALSLPVIQDGGFYKNLLQEYAQKKGLLCPTYETLSSGLPHRPTFVSVVTVGTDTFQGDEANIKKLAEMSAAKAAYFALTKGSEATNSSKVPTINNSPVSGNISQHIQPTATIRKYPDTTCKGPDLQAKRAKA